MAIPKRELGEPGQGLTGPVDIEEARHSASELDDTGIPSDLSVDDWLDLPDGDGALGPPGTRWLQAVLRFTRPDGSTVFGPIGRSVGRVKALQEWAARLGDPSLSGVVGRWRSSPSGSGPSPVPTYSSPDRPLAVLRPDWSPRGDLVAIDHRQ